MKKNTAHLIAEGAEAKIIFFEGMVRKERVRKGYRLLELDEKIRKRRTKSERKLLLKASNLIDTPVPKEDKEKFSITMPFIEGDKISETLDTYSLGKKSEILKKIGESLAKLHDNEIIHGDLTTSNTILRDNKVYIIDFGLGFISSKNEDRAVDVHLFKQALDAKHFQDFEKLYASFLEGYKEHDFFEQVLEKLKVVEKRGRYRH